MLRKSERQTPSAITAQLVIAALLATTAMGCTQKAGAAVLSCPNIDKIQQVFLNQHISGTDPDAVFEGRLVEQYIKRMDGAKIYLLESDVADIKKDMKGIFAQLKKGECGPLDKVQDLFVKRVQDRSDYAKKTLTAKNFKFDQKTELMLDPDARSFPKTKAEADTFQGKYLQFQISNYIATGMTQKEAQDKVVRNYERVVKRIKETSKEDLYSGYLDSFGRAKDPHSSYF
ncbi:MAG: tail-specific protease, partial [Proteobacteria bacterium]